MKKTVLILLMLVNGFSEIYCQQSIVASGGEATGSGGTMSYSAGQVLYTTQFGSNGSIAQGVQQAAPSTILTQVQTSQCGVNLSAINVSIYANLVSIATGYRFKVTKVIGGFPSTNPVDIQIIDKPTRSFKITDLALYAYNTTYQVEVAIKIGLYWQPFYGPPCNVTTPNTSTQIRTIQCNTTLGLMTDDVFADITPYVAGYRFRIKHSITLVSQTYDNPLRVYKMSYLSSPIMDYGTTYIVDVALKNYDGTYTAYGTTCTITTPSFPTTQIQTIQCGMTASSGSQTIYANLVSSASVYRFRLTNASLTYSSTQDNSLRSFNLNQFAGLSPNTTYDVDVSVKVGGVFGPYGPICTLTTPNVFKKLPTKEIVEEFEVIANPNPFADNFKLDIKTKSNSQIQVRIYDMIGKLLSDEVIDRSKISDYQMGSKYPSGVYNVIVTQEDNIETIRVIKR